MSLSQLNIHKVKKVEYRRKSYGGFNEFHTLEIKVTNEDGKEFEVCLYSEERADLDMKPEED